MKRIVFVLLVVLVLGGVINTMSLLAAGAGAVSRTIPSQLGDIISVKDFGAIGDGFADDTTKIQAALTAAKGTTLYFPKGTYVVTSKLTVPVDTHILGAGPESTVIDASGATISSIALIYAAGAGVSASLGGSPTGAITAGDLTITLTSAPSLNPGDLIILHDPANGSWNPVDNTYRKGEFLIVKSLSGAVITLTSAVIDDYPGTAEVYSVSTTSTTIRDLKIIGNTADTANLPTIRIRYGRNNIIENVRLQTPTANGIEIKESFGFTGRRIEIGKYINDSGRIQAAGVLLVNCQYCRVADSILISDRHGASLSGGGLVVTRFSVFENNYIASRVSAAADFHGHEEFSGYRNNYIVGGGTAFNLSGARNFIVGNDVYEGNSATTLINWESVISVETLIQGNRFTLSNARFVIDASATTDINSDTSEDGVFKFNDNRIFDLSAVDNVYMNIKNNGSTADNHFEFKRNIIEKTNTGFFGSLMGMSRVSGDSFDSLFIEGNRFINAGMGITSDVTDYTIRGNYISQPSNNSRAGSFTTRTLGNIVFEGNYISGYNKNLVLSGSAGDKSTILSLKGNTVIGGALDSSANLVTILNITEVISANNLIGNASDSNQVNPVSFGSTVDSLTINGDIYLGNVPDINNSIEGIGPSTFEFKKQIDLATPATAFTIWTIPANTSFVPTETQSRTNTIITATTGNFISIGVNAANRRVDYGVNTVAAASSQHAKNSKHRFINSSELANTMATSTEIISLMSVDGTGDAALIAGKIGGAGQTITIRMRGRLIGNLPDAP